MQFGLSSGRQNTNNKAPAVPELSILSAEFMTDKFQSFEYAKHRCKKPRPPKIEIP